MFSAHHPLASDCWQTQRQTQCSPRCAAKAGFVVVGVFSSHGAIVVQQNGSRIPKPTTVSASSMSTKDSPILMSAPMVRATLAGTKSQTRRAVKHPLLKDLSRIINCGDGWWGDEEGEVQARCPYGQPGDRLWVREAWSHDAESLDQCRASAEDAMGGGAYGPYYRATEVAPDTLSWKPSILMPRWVSRITLLITSVRVERLQNISEADAMAEGIERLPAPVIDGGWSGPNRFTLKGMGSGACAGLVSWNAPTATELYQRLWTEINGPESWDANPWVWVVEFKRVEAA